MPKEFEIYNIVHPKFNIMNRIRILFGRKVRIESNIFVDKDVKIIRSSAMTLVENFIDRTPVMKDAASPFDNQNILQ